MTTFLLLAAATPVLAAPPSSLFGLGGPGLGRREDLGLPVQLVVLMTVLTLLPAVLVSLTPFLRISIVLHFLRQALGTQTVPSNQVLVGLSLFLSLLVVQPVLQEAYDRGWAPLERGQVSRSEAWDQGTRPIRTFLLRFAKERDITLMLEVTRSAPPRQASDLSLSILAPAYVLSELKAGFQIGAVLFLPFLIIDLVVASVALSIGMVQLPPVMISAPFKILLFVLVDGWGLIVGSLMKSIH